MKTATPLADPAVPSPASVTEPRPANDTAVKAAPTAITIWEIKTKGWTRGGHKHEGEVVKGHHAQIVPGVSIRLFGEVGPRYSRAERGVIDGGVYKRDYRIGDTAMVGSYNLVYTGTITSITEKTVTVVEYQGSSLEKSYRFAISDFDRMNWDFSAGDAAERNANWSD